MPQLFHMGSVGDLGGGGMERLEETWSCDVRSARIEHRRQRQFNWILICHHVCFTLYTQRFATPKLRTEYQTMRR